MSVFTFCLVLWHVGVCVFVKQSKERADIVFCCVRKDLSIRWILMNGYTCIPIYNGNGQTQWQRAWDCPHAAITVKRQFYISICVRPADETILRTRWCELRWRNGGGWWLADSVMLQQHLLRLTDGRAGSTICVIWWVTCQQLHVRGNIVQLGHHLSGTFRYVALNRAACVNFSYLTALIFTFAPHWIGIRWQLTLKPTLHCM